MNSRASSTPDWLAIVDGLIDQVADADPLYRPTNFWGPGVESLLADFRTRGLTKFKSWTTSQSWFYPVYGDKFSPKQIREIHQFANERNPNFTMARAKSVLGGAQEARRDLHAAQLAWDQERWPFDVVGYGESSVGKPPRLYRLSGADGPGWNRGYLNYLLCLSALSRHVDAPPSSFLEIGGGYGALAEIVFARNPGARYVNADIPPVGVIAAYYLSEVVGDCVLPDALPDGEFAIERVGVIPSWRLPDLRGDFDAFVNSYSFQEMEPDVVANYIDLVCDRGLRYAVSLNSRAGKRKAEPGLDGGAVEPVTSQFIVDCFARHGFETAGRYGAPLVHSAGELVVFRRKGCA